MTATSELFVTEEVRDLVEEKLRDKGMLGERDYIEIECPKEWGDIWTRAEFPSEGKAKILDGGTDEEVGVVEWRTEFFIDSDLGLYINATPHLTRLKYKGKEAYVDKSFEVYLSIHVHAEDVNEAANCIDYKLSALEAHPKVSKIDVLKVRELADVYLKMSDEE